MTATRDYERDWTTRSGLRAVIGRTWTMANLCGYVQVPSDHPLYGVGYTERADCLMPLVGPVESGPAGKRSPITVMLMASGGGVEPTPEHVFNVHGSVTYAGDLGEDGTWWYGFDCGHLDDTPEVWTLDAVSEECESFADQIAAVAEEGGEK